MKTITDKSIVLFEQQCPACGFGPQAAIETCRFDLLKACLNRAPREGFDLAGMRKRARALDQIERAKDGMAALEDADFDTLLEAFRSFRWGTAARGILELEDHLNDVRDHGGAKA